MPESQRGLAIAGCCAALGSLVPVALFQAGLLEKLPDPPGKVFDSERITSSKTAHPLGIPDAFLGLANYSATLGLLVLSKRSVVARRLLAVKLAGDAGIATFNAVRQVAKFGKLCSWCTGTALATAVTVYGGRSVIGETVREAYREL